MKIEFLCSNLWPLFAEKDQKVISDCFIEEIKKSDQLDISVGYASCDSLRELDRLVIQQKMKNVCLILGMYFFIKFPEKLRELAFEINEKWQKAGIGEIRVAWSFKYHGKLYCFYKNDQIHSIILGSQNLSFLVEDEITRSQQYEIALFTDEPKILQKTANHIEKLKLKQISENIAVLEEKQLFSDRNLYLRSKQEISKIRWKNDPNT